MRPDIFSKSTRPLYIYCWINWVSGGGCARIHRAIECPDLMAIGGNAQPDYAERVSRTTLSKVALSEIGDTLHAGGSHPGPGGVERGRQIDRPAPGLEQDGGEAESARVHGGKVDAIVGREPRQEDSPQA